VRNGTGALCDPSHPGPRGGTYSGPIGHLVGDSTKLPARSSSDAAGIELRKCHCSQPKHHQMVRALSTIRAGQRAYTHGREISRLVCRHLTLHVPLVAEAPQWLTGVKQAVPSRHRCTHARTGKWQTVL
jgi:hypothetical protein